MFIGSYAMAQHYSDTRPFADIDVLGHEIDQDFGDYRMDCFWHDSFPWEWALDLVATPHFLYTLKVSHSFWDLHGTWNKHMYDIYTMQTTQTKTGQWAQFSRPVYDILLPVWKEKHGKKKTSLAMSKEDFFSDNVKRKYDHDSIHASVAYRDRPWYVDILKPGSEVEVDTTLFFNMNYEDRLQLVREEVYATALERWVIPSNYTCSPRGAYAKALKKTITSLFKGEWALWTVLNYNALLKPDVDYVAVHKSNQHKLILL